MHPAKTATDVHNELCELICVLSVENEQLRRERDDPAERLIQVREPMSVIATERIPDRAAVDRLTGCIGRVRRSV
jgi:hypothetical protein